MGAFAIDYISLSVEEPSGNLELGGVVNDVDDAFQLVRVEVASAGARGV